jgi:hypothetical protein
MKKQGWGMEGVLIQRMIGVNSSILHKKASSVRAVRYPDIPSETIHCIHSKGNADKLTELTIFSHHFREGEELETDV